MRDLRIRACYQG